MCGARRRGPGDTEIGGQPANVELFESALAQIAAEAGGGLAVRFEERGIAVDLAMVALADDELCLRDLQILVQLGAASSLDAVRGPKHLFAVGQAGGLEGLAPGMGGGERDVVARMPVLREHDVRKAAGEAVDDGHDLVALRHGERAAWHEVVLHVDDDQDAFFGSRTISTRVRSAAVYERQPRPCTEPFAAEEMIEWCRHSSRVARFDRCTSITGKGIALMQSCSETLYCVRPAGLRIAPAASSMCFCRVSTSTPSWFDCTIVSLTWILAASVRSRSLICSSVVVP